MRHKFIVGLNQMAALSLAVLLSAAPAAAGLLVRGTEGITMTGADGVSYEEVSGITMTGADGLLGMKVNGISAPSAVSDGITMTGADGVLYTGTNGITMTGADGITMTGADGITVTGADGITMTGADGTTYHVDSVVVRRASGITMTGADGITMTGADGLQLLGLDGITMTGADGITMTRADSLRLNTADGVVLTGADGRVFAVSPSGITMTGADGITMTGADGITMTGADGLLLQTGAGDAVAAGLQALDPELALLLNRVTDDSNISAVVTFHRYPGEADLEQLRALGIHGGTRFRRLPILIISTTRAKLVELSRLPSVRSIWGKRTLRWDDAATRALTGVERARADADLARANAGLPVTGRGVSVAVLDTGLDATHADLSGRVARNVKLADLQGLSPLGFQYPLNLEGLPSTDPLSGHGTFVAGLIAGSGARSGGKYAGVAPGASLVGLSAGDATLLFVLAGLDYLLERGPALGVRVVNCSFSANTLYDEGDPINVATRMLADAGVNVVFSAGNSGPGADTLNPYALAPWVISVGATDARGRLADFSSRGSFGSAARRPTLVAPGVEAVSLRALASLNLTGLLGLTSGADSQLLSPSELPYYTTASGTSFSAPVVAGVIALMLEANPSLTPAEVRDILQRTATPLAPRSAHEVGAGLLNAHAAVLEAAFPDRRFGLWRAALDTGQVRFIKDAPHEFGGAVLPGRTSAVSLPVPEHAVHASVRIAWGPLLTVNDLGMKVYEPSGTLRANVDTLNLPGLTGRREAAQLLNPAAGLWRVAVSNTLGLLGTPQDYAGVLEVARVEYAELPDLAGLSPAAREDVQQTLRSFVLTPFGRYFRPDFAVTRAQLSAALVRGARVPQYVPAVPTYTDVRSRELMHYVESVQAAPTGPAFDDAPAGGTFRPDARVTRLSAAVALVRAAGLRAEAESYAGLGPEVLDVAAIPSELRGYVAVALARGLLRSEGGYFRPQSPLTRALVALSKLREG